MMTGWLLEEVYKLFQDKVRNQEAVSCSFGGAHCGMPPEITVTTKDGFGNRHTLILAATEINHDDNTRVVRRLRLMGVQEAADFLGISRQRLYYLRTHNRYFPSPVAVLAVGPVWCAEDIEKFQENRDRRPGRPKKEKEK